MRVTHAFITPTHAGRIKPIPIAFLEIIWSHRYRPCRLFCGRTARSYQTCCIHWVATAMHSWIVNTVKLAAGYSDHQGRVPKTNVEDSDATGKWKWSKTYVSWKPTLMHARAFSKQFVCHLELHYQTWLDVICQSLRCLWSMISETDCVRKL